MPLYDVQHSYPLTREQKDRVAEAITRLHSTMFHTPSMFVNIRFIATEPQGDFYVAGTPTEPASPNRILALVRMGADRTKKMFDDLSEEIEKEWNKIVKYDSTLHPATTEDKAKKLHIISWTAVIGARENGVLLPGTGEEKTWLKSYMSYFKERAEMGRDEMFAAMLKEIEGREDLRAIV
ncbi:hypothetical protein F5884DRAFT_902973 [Xylogone sp. PMI_703]|nr:hypothetical protein F5884DRAFT_902973 [Xylogone sp. PMI_703]